MFTRILSKLSRPTAFTFRRSYMRVSDKMPRMSVRSVPGEERMQISFIYSAEGEPGAGKERVFNFDRLQSEEVGKTLVRINSNVAKVVNKKKKKKNRSPTEMGSTSPEGEGEGPNAELYNGDVLVDSDTQNRDAWREGRQLNISNMSYHVQVNPPSIRGIIVPEVIMAGFPLYPRVDAEFVDFSKCTIVWYKEEKAESGGGGGNNTPSSGSATDLTSGLLPTSRSEQLTNRDWKVGTPVQCGGEVRPSVSETSDLSGQTAPTDNCLQSQTPSPSMGAKVPKKGKKTVNGSMSNLNWNEVHRSLVYTPGSEDIGHKLRVVVTPSDGTRVGDDVDIVTTEVTMGPGKCPFENRHILTKERTGQGSFRVVTYNILADLYADSDFSRDYLYPYCPPHALQADYRKQVINKEIAGYNTDILCLQEVDRRLFINDLEPILELQGMTGRLKTKYSEVAEGAAIFWHKDKFRCIGQNDLHLSEALQTDPDFSTLYEQVCTKEGLKTKVLERKTILQICILQSVEDPSHKIIVGNTHLYFHPRAGHVRLVQTTLCVQHISRTVSQLEKQYGSRPSIVFCGDFNTTPNHGVYEFVTQGYLPANSADWYSAGREEHLANLELRHSLKMECASGTPQYTNFVAGFADCLDYIFISRDSLLTRRVVPLPTHQEVTAYTALPNPAFPSDHLPLICDIDWR